MRRSALDRLIANLLLGLPCILGLPSAVSGQPQPQVSLPPNSAIRVCLAQQLETSSAQPEETFLATLSKTIVIDDRIVFARGTKVVGRVREAVSSNRLQRPASITLELTEIGGIPIGTRSLRIGGKKRLLREVKLIGSDARTSNLFSGMAWVESGAGMGIGIGGGSRTATHYVTNDNEIVLPAETVLVFNSLDPRSARKD